MTAVTAIPVSHKFSAIAFDDCMAVKLSSASVDLAPGLRAFKAAPFELPQQWKEWLGTLQAGHFAKSNLVLMVDRPSSTPTDLDQETRDRERELSAFVFALMMSGVPDYRETIWFSGANVDGEISVRGLRRLDVFYRTPGQLRPVLDDASMITTAKLGTKILDLFRSQDYRRVRVGFNKLIEGLKSPQPRDRLHEFVRSIDGLMALEAGKSTRQFVHRGHTVASFVNGIDTCRTFYDLRSAEEHLNDWRQILDPTGNLDGFALEASGLTWADAAQRLATDIYRRLLLSPALLSEFKDETSTKAFWALDDKERQRRWGAPMSLELDSKPFRFALSVNV
jgi:hypothetical protein